MLYKIETLAAKDYETHRFSMASTCYGWRLVVWTVLD